MPNPLLPFEQAVSNLEQPLLDAKAAHEAAQAKAQTEIREAADLRDQRCAPHFTKYTVDKAKALAKSLPAADAYAAKRVEFDAAVRARNEARREVGRDAAP